MLTLDHTIGATPFAAAVSVVTALLVGQTPEDVQNTPPRPPVPQEQSDSSSRTPLGMVVNWARTIKASQRQSESVIWEQVLASQDGSVVCLAYRTHSREGEVRERVAFVSSTSGYTKIPWDSACTHNVSIVADAEKWIGLP